MAMNLLGLLVTVAGLAGYATLAAVRHPSGSVVFAGWEWLVGLLALVAAIGVLLVLHEGTHALAMLRTGARPSFGVGMAGGILPYAYTTARGHLFSPLEYVAVALAPSLVLIPVTVALVGWAPYGGWLVLPAAIHLGGCIGDWWLVALAARQPSGSRFEDLEDGLRVHRR